MKRVAVIAIAGTLSLSALPALAHHSGTMFEPAKMITVNGTVKEFEYANPHAWLLVDVKGADSSVTTWSFEMGELSTLTRAGIHKQDFAPGMQVTISGRPMKDGRPAGQFQKAVRADGQVFTTHGREANQPPNPS
jgi:hypothetical protein